MGQTAKATRQNRTITVDFQDESTYFQLLPARRLSSSSSPSSSRSAFNSTIRQAARGRLFDTPFPLCPGSSWRSHYLAHPVHLVQGGIHGVTALRPTLSAA